MRRVSRARTGAAYRSGGSWLARLSNSSVFAWTLSLSLHAALFLVFYRMVVREEAEARVIIIPEAHLVAAPGPVGPVAPAPAPMQLAQVPEPVASPSVGSPAPELPVLSIASGGPGGVVLPGLQTDQRSSGNPSGTWGGSVAGAVAGSGVGSGGGGVGAPASQFFGQAGNAYKVVYVVDVSASLMIYMDEIAREMRGSIAALLPSQRFHIVLAKPGEVQEFAPRRLVPAIAQYKKQANAYLDTITGVPRPGKADPVEAMRRAFAAGPELIYFLSDGDYSDVQARLESTLRELNAKRTVKMTVIGFDPSPIARSLLERIAREHGGHFRVVQPK